MKKELLKNLEYSEKYIQKNDVDSIPEMLDKFLLHKRVYSVLDLGCGYGNLIRSLSKKYPGLEITGVDISPRRVEYLKKSFPKFHFFVEDVSFFKSNKKFDLVVSTQVIEHLNQPNDFINNILNLLSNNGFLYIDSVVKKPYAIYKYWNQGKFVLDPTHYHEFKSMNHFTSFFAKNFEILNKNIFPVKRKILGLTLRIPGFYICQTLLKKK